MINAYYEDYFLNYEIANSSPQRVFDWLKENAPESRYNIREPSRYGLELSLLARKDVLINLGLALYGTDMRTGLALYNSARSLYSNLRLEMAEWAHDIEVIQLACLSGTTITSQGTSSESWISAESFISEWIESCSDLSSYFGNPSDSRLRALLKNPNLPPDMFIDLFEKKGPYAGLDNDKWARFLSWAFENERLKSMYAEVEDFYPYNKVFCSYWLLFDKLDCNKGNAKLLLELRGGSFFYNALREKPPNMNVMEVIAKWKDGLVKEEYLSAQISELLITLAHNDDDFEALQDNEDLAIRLGYYSSIKVIEPESVDKWYRKDREKFLKAARYNQYMFQNDGVREALYAAHVKAYSNFEERQYLSMEDYWFSKHPKWFENRGVNYKENYFDKIETSATRKQIGLEQINDKLVSIFNSLDGKVEEITQNVAKFHAQKISSRYWGLAGLAVGYILSELW